MFLNLFNIIGSLALFLFGMKIMSNGIQKVSGVQIRRFLDKMTKNLYSGALAGFVITSIMQSSSAFSVLLLGFVNAKVMNLKKAMTLIIGSNIGTTTTLWIFISLIPGKVEYTVLPLIAIGFPLYLNRDYRKRNWGQILIGFALIFVALGFLRIFTPPLEEIYEYINPAISISYFYFLVFIGIGLILTIIIQSSSATTALILVSLNNGLPLELAIMMIIGANIGTTMTAHLASSISNFNTKAVALFHTCFNIVGAILFFFFVESILDFLAHTFHFEDSEVYLAIFHTLFNVITAGFFLLLFPLWVGIFVRYSRKFSRNKENDSKLIYNQPEIYLFKANQEVLSFAGTTRQIIQNLGRLITESNANKFEELKERVRLLKEQGDVLEKNVLQDLRKIYNFETEGIFLLKAHNLMDVCYHLENVGDMALKIADIHIKRRESRSYFTPRLRTLLIELHDSLSLAASNLIQNLNSKESQIIPGEAIKIEKKINEQYQHGKTVLLITLEKEKIPMLSILYYQELIQNYEIIGDHIFKANQSLSN